MFSADVQWPRGHRRPLPRLSSAVATLKVRYAARTALYVLSGCDRSSVLRCVWWRQQGLPRFVQKIWAYWCSRICIDDILLITSRKRG
jgi:hypothetical protein